MNKNYHDIIFSRSSVARILDCTILTIRNREKNGVYPESQRLDNNYRVYGLFDVFKLQEISHDKIYFGPLFSELWDMGFKDPAKCQTMLDTAILEYKSTNGEKK